MPTNFSLTSGIVTRRAIPQFVAIVGLFMLCADAAVVQGQEQPAPPDPKGVEFFENRVRPLLAERCFECHGPEKQKGNLRLDSLEAILQGGDSGPALIKGKPEESLLAQVVGYSFDIKMPPKSKLPEREIADLVQWIKLGAPWPAAAGAAGIPGKTTAFEITAEQRAFWAFQPPADLAPPAVKNEAWVKNSLDRFILHRLEAAALTPAAPATKRQLIRRATFDLIGLPPSPTEVEAFVADDATDAFAKVIDRLLASPHYGERWGRHWLDVARYADSNGFDENLAYANAWRYRDYVISAFNRDKPINRFIEEQIAGDLLEPASPDHSHENIVATGFLCLGGKMLAEDDPVKMQMDIIDEQVDTVGRAFLGMTLGCARCHSHKFDPIPIDDYYSLAGIFKSTKTMENFSVVARWQERPLATAEALAQRDEHQKRIDARQQELNRATSLANQRLVLEARGHAADYLIRATEEIERSEFLKKTAPIGADPANMQKRTATIIEAEDFARGNVLKVTTGYGEGIGVLVNKGELPNFTEYDVTIEADATYQFEVRYAAAASRPTKLFIDGKLVHASIAGGITGSWNPDTQTWEVAAFSPLQKGSHVLRLECAGPFPHIDKLLFAPAKTIDGIPVAPLASPQDGYNLQRGFVERWIKLFQDAKEGESTLFSLWKEYSATGRILANNAFPLSVRLAAVAPASRHELAIRLAGFASTAEKEWQHLKSSGDGANATELADPVLESVRKLLYDPKGPFDESAIAPSDRNDAERNALANLQKEIKSLQESHPKLPETMAVSDAQPQDLRVHLRGSHLTLGELAPRRFPAIFSRDYFASKFSGSGRRELAAWLVKPDHPLTSRVFVNRVWLWHFGEGLVRSPDNFGSLGERPTHPELLDWLSQRFMEQGWSLKQLHRLIMLSATYQMSVADDPQAAMIDPENRLWRRFNRRRLEAEALRDGVLAVCGELDEATSGSLLPTPNRAYVTGTGSNLPPALYTSKRRSVYLPVVRSALFEMFQAFDFADPSVLNGKRDTTTVAPQALFMMNSQLVSQATRAYAERLLKNTGLDDAARVQAIFLQAYSRPATELEIQRSLEFVRQYTMARQAQSVSAEEAVLCAWQALCRAVLSANEFAYVE